MAVEAVAIAVVAVIVCIWIFHLTVLSSLSVGRHLLLLLLPFHWLPYIMNRRTSIFIISIWLAIARPIHVRMI